MKKIQRDILFLGLVFIVLFILVNSLYSASALDEIQDDYLNETYIQEKHNIVRNNVFNAMELNYTGIIADFTEFTKVDPTPQKITINSAIKVSWLQMDRNEDRRIWKDYGNGYFGDFIHYFDFTITDIEAGDSDGRDIIALWRIRVVEDAWQDELYCYLAQSGLVDDVFKIGFVQRDGGGTEFAWADGDYPLGSYYVTVSRVGNICRFKMYSDSARTTLLIDSGNKVGVNDAYRYMALSVGWDYVNDPFDYSSGYIENVNWGSGEYIWDIPNILVGDGWIEVDEGGDNLKYYNSTHVWFDNVDRDEGDRLYKDYGNNYFDIDFMYYFRLRTDNTHGSNPRCYFMALSEESESIYDTIIADKNYCGFFKVWSNADSRFVLQLRMFDGTTLTSDLVTTDDDLELEHWYHVIYSRVNNNVTAWFYEDALLTDLAFMLTITASDVDNLRYLHVLNSETQAVGGRAMDLDIAQVRNRTTTSGGYEDSGYFYTTEMLSAVNGSTVVLLTNATIPVSDSITVEFSNDASTWVDHNGNVGFDLLVDGNESLDLRDLGYTELNVRYNFSDGGADSTPRLYQMIVITSGEGNGNGNGVTTIINVPLIVFGLTIGLIIGMGLKSK